MIVTYDPMSGLSARARNTLRHLGVVTIDDVLKVDITKRQLLFARNCGKKTVEEIEQFYSVRMGRFDNGRCPSCGQTVPKTEAEDGK